MVLKHLNGVVGKFIFFFETFYTFPDRIGEPQRKKTLCDLCVLRSETITKYNRLYA